MGLSRLIPDPCNLSSYNPGVNPKKTRFASHDDVSSGCTLIALPIKLFGLRSGPRPYGEGAKMMKTTIALAAILLRGWHDHRPQLLQKRDQYRRPCRKPLGRHRQDQPRDRDLHQRDGFRLADGELRDADRDRGEHDLHHFVSRHGGLCGDRKLPPHSRAAQGWRAHCISVEWRYSVWTGRLQQRQLSRWQL